MRKKILAANWKMNLVPVEARAELTLPGEAGVKPGTGQVATAGALLTCTSMYPIYTSDTAGPE